VNAGYVVSGSGASSSAILDPNQSPLCGSGLNGNMPLTKACLTAAQVAEINCWLASGAPDN
jgi:hypothetical protein